MTEKDYETKVQEIAQSACYDKAEKLTLPIKATTYLMPKGLRVLSGYPLFILRKRNGPPRRYP